MRSQASKAHTRIVRLLATLLAIVLTASVTAFLSSSPSTAAPNRLLVSNTNGSFSDNLTTPLFENLGPFVPMDSETETFYVKNNSNQPARASFAVLSTRGAGQPKNAFEENLTFSYRVGGTDGQPTVIERPQNKCKAYVTGETIAPGASQPIDVTLDFGDVAGQTAMNQTARVSFVVTLSQVTQKGMIDICGTQAVAEPFAACKSPNAAVVPLVGRTMCAQVAGVEAFADGDRSAAAAGVDVPHGGAPNALGETGAPRSLTTVLPLALGLLLAGALLLAARRREAD